MYHIHFLPHTPCMHICMHAPHMHKSCMHTTSPLLDTYALLSMRTGDRGHHMRTVVRCQYMYLLGVAEFGFHSGPSLELVTPLHITHLPPTYKPLLSPGIDTKQKAQMALQITLATIKIYSFNTTVATKQIIGHQQLLQSIVQAV